MKGILYAIASLGALLLMLAGWTLAILAIKRVAAFVFLAIGGLL